MNKFKIVCFSFVIFQCLIVPIYAYVYPNNATGYPYANSPKDQVDQWNTFTRNCTSYTMWKINQAGLPFHNNPTGPNGSSTTMGNASTWDERAGDIGYTVNSTPSAGNPVNWEANSGGAGPAGHVAWVEQVNPNNSMFISEWNWNFGDGNYNERNLNTGDHHLHLIVSGNCNGGNVNFSNKNVNNGQTFNCNVTSGNTMTVNPESNFYLGSNVTLTSN